MRPADPMVFILPAAPPGSDTYDKRMCQNLPAVGQPVLELPIAGDWPEPDATSRRRLARSLAALPDRTVVLLDGMIASGVPEIVVPHARRLRLAVLVHQALADEPGLTPSHAAELDACERETLRMAGMVVATSPWLARLLIDRHDLDPGRVYVAKPGTDAAPLAAGADGVSRLLCVGDVTRRNGHDVLVQALGEVDHLALSCVFAGSLEADPAFVGELGWSIERLGLGNRITLAGDAVDLGAAYNAADLLVIPARAATSGMFVAQALARGIPVLAAEVGGVYDALGVDADGEMPGLLVEPDDPFALADALHRWYADPELRRSLRTAALGRGSALEEWEVAARRLTYVLSRLASEPRIVA
jgi:glycosyltransferase involved in cell wall biosynthesis